MRSSSQVLFVTRVPLAAGATFLGGCCGTTPDFIRALVDAPRCRVIRGLAGVAGPWASRMGSLGDLCASLSGCVLKRLFLSRFPEWDEARLTSLIHQSMCLPITASRFDLYAIARAQRNGAALCGLRAGAGA